MVLDKRVEYSKKLLDSTYSWHVNGVEYLYACVCVCVCVCMCVCVLNLSHNTLFPIIFIIPEYTRCTPPGQSFLPHRT